MPFGRPIIPRRRLLAVLLLLATCVAPLGAGDWPQYRGPDRSGVVADGGLLASWTEEGPTVAWRRSIGSGFSGLAVRGERLYTLEANGSEEALLAIDRRTGDTVWRTVVGETDEFFPGGGPRSTPTVIGERLFAVSSKSRLLAVDTTSGELVWEHDLAQYGPVPRYGYSVSPLVDGDNVVVLAGDRGKGPGVIAFDRTSGDIRWQALEGPTGYSSPIVAEIGGTRQYVFSTFTGIVGLATDGTLLWQHDTGPKTALPMPVFVPPDSVFVAAADDTFGGLLIRITADGDAFRTEEVWKERLMRNHFNTSVLVDGFLYGFDNATFRCLDAENGERRWAARGFGKGSLVASGDLLFVLSDTGEVALVHATPEAYREAGRLEVMEGRSWTSPSLADGHLYVRDFDELVSLDLRSGVGTATATVSAPRPSTTTEGVTFGPDGLAVGEILARHAAARGGERWEEVERLELSGTYTAFSQPSDFRLLRLADDRYRLQFDMLGGPAIRARDATGPWWRHQLLAPEAARIEEGPYKPLLERESLFGPPLRDAATRGLAVELVGSGEINGRTTIDLEVTFPEGSKETWHLDPTTYLEVAVDSQVHDLTQSEQPMTQRAFYGDFREIDGLVIPFRVDLEFGARLEEMRVEEVRVDGAVDESWIEGPEKTAER